jgi:gas vesicle protein
MSEVGGNGNGNGTWKTIAVPVATLLLGGSVGIAAPRTGEEARVVVLETKMDALKEEVKELKDDIKQMDDKLSSVMAALPGLKEKRQ